MPSDKHPPTLSVRIAVVCKYELCADSYASLVHAISFSAAFLRTNAKIEWIRAEDLERGEEALGRLRNVDGILIPGGFGERGVEGKIKAIRYGRENMVPLLGICLGYQLSIIEMCRNILGIEDALSEEFCPGGKKLVIRYITDEDGASDRRLRTGSFGVRLSDGGMVKELYGGSDVVYERHRHRYEVDRGMIGELERCGVRFVGRSTDGKIAKIFELSGHPFFVGVQFHPEFSARPDKPHALITGFMRHSYEHSKRRSP
jgi:CTP synthase